MFELNSDIKCYTFLLSLMRRKLAKKYIDEGYKIKEWKSRKDRHKCSRQKSRDNRVDQLKITFEKDEEFKQPHDGYFEGEGDKAKFINYLLSTIYLYNYTNINKWTVTYS